MQKNFDILIIFFILTLTIKLSKSSTIFPRREKIGKCQNGSCSKLRRNYDWVEWKDMNKIKYLSQLTFSSIMSTILSHPLHVICMRQQVIH